MYLPKDCEPGENFRHVTVTGPPEKREQCLKMIQMFMTPPGCSPRPLRHLPPKPYQPAQPPQLQQPMPFAAPMYMANMHMQAMPYMQAPVYPPMDYYFPPDMMPQDAMYYQAPVRPAMQTMQPQIAPCQSMELSQIQVCHLLTSAFLISNRQIFFAAMTASPCDSLKLTQVPLYNFKT